MFNVLGFFKKFKKQEVKRERVLVQSFAISQEDAEILDQIKSRAFALNDMLLTMINERGALISAEAEFWDRYRSIQNIDSFEGDEIEFSRAECKVKLYKNN